MTGIEQGCKNMARRIVTAQDDFIANVMEIASCTKPEAEKVLATYRRFKLFRRDAVGGTLRVKHGAFLDADVLRRAIEA